MRTGVARQVQKLAGRAVSFQKYVFTGSAKQLGSYFFDLLFMVFIVDPGGKRLFDVGRYRY